MRIIKIRGVPHDLDRLEEVGRRIGGELITNPHVIKRLDFIFAITVQRTGKPPTLIEDEVTHDRFAVVVGQLQTESFPIRTKIYYKMTRQVI